MYFVIAETSEEFVDYSRDQKGTQRKLFGPFEFGFQAREKAEEVLRSPMGFVKAHVVRPQETATVPVTWVKG